jgi:hypothetical protein
VRRPKIPHSLIESPQKRELLRVGGDSVRRDDACKRLRAFPAAGEFHFLAQVGVGNYRFVAALLPSCGKHRAWLIVKRIAHGCVSFGLRNNSLN